MNTTNILAVADAIEQHTIPWLGFNMNSYFARNRRDDSGHNCGTVACIAGWANAIQIGQDFLPMIETMTDDELRSLGSIHIPPEGVKKEISVSAAEWMDLDSEAADRLFYEWDATADQAVRTLRHLAATGQVDWTV